jgi:hypothetical protein
MIFSRGSLGLFRLFLLAENQRRKGWSGKFGGG